MVAYEALAGIYDDLMADVPYTEWLSFATEYWNKAGKPSTIVDIGCGTGSLAVSLAKQGLQVTGIDLSEEMLALASAKQLEQTQEILQSGGSLQFLQQDMREWALAEPVQCVVSFCDSLNYLLEEEDIQAAFASTYKGLADQGVFLFDMHSLYQLQEYADEQPFVLDEEQVSYIWYSHLDEQRCEIEHDLTIFVQEASGLYRRFEEVHYQRAYSLDWVCDALYQVGFKEVSVAADFCWDSLPQEQSKRFFFAARK